MNNRAPIVIACLATMLATALAGCSGTPPPVVPPVVFPPTLSVTPDNWNAGQLEIGIDTALYAENVTISQISYKIYDENGTVIFSGPAGVPQSHAGVAITITYIDSSNTGKVNAGDKFHISLNPADETGVTGGTFEAFYNNENIVSVSI